MKIDMVEITKFRSIFKCTVRFGRINAIVGENNGGKTAILRALNAFFNYNDEETSFNDNTHQFAKRSNTKISIRFSEVPNKSIYRDKVLGDTLYLEFAFSYSDKRKTLTCYKNLDKFPLDDKFIQELKNDIDYVYIPPNRSNFDLSWSPESVFSKLVTTYASQYTQYRDNISRSVKTAADKLQNTILKKIEKQISDLYMLNDSADFMLDYTEPIEYSMFLNKLGLKVKDCGAEYPIRECGSGIKSLTVISLYRSLASMSNSSIVLGIEEPETNLHPQAQKRLISSLKNNLQVSEVQTIFATHSTVIVDELAHEDIILVRREKDEKRGFRSKVTQLSETFWEDNGIQAFKHYQFFKYRNSDFFFSKHVILTESPIDGQVIDKLIKDEVKDKIFDVSILNLNGITNLKYPYFLLKELEIPFSMVVDKDFFVPYLNNDNLEESRNASTGLPRYAANLKTDGMLFDIFSTASERHELEIKINGSYKEFFNFLRPYKIFSMNYCLEMDLCCSENARQQYYRIFSMRQEEQSQKQLLISKKNAIKDADKILAILENLPKASYPASLSKIKKALSENVIEIRI